MTDFYGHHRSELEDYCSAQGLSPVHATTLFATAYKKFSNPITHSPGLPRRLHAAFATDGLLANPLEVKRALHSAYDGSVKFLFKLGDGLEVEAVLMPESRRITACLSTQVGCAQACSFCHTGRMGLQRSLSAGEIIGQVVALNKWVAEHPVWLERAQVMNARRVTNIVFMGMGEPLDNAAALIKAIGIMNDPRGLDLPLKRISVSTAGHLDGLRQVLAQFPKIPVALSLHAATDAERSRLMPINRRWPIATLIAEIKRMNAECGNPILIQYTLIAGVNDSEEEAHRLGVLLTGLQLKINLIPLNEIDPSRFRSPAPARLQAFRNVLHRLGFRVMVRYSKGQDIGAACGQLITSK